MPKGNCLAGVLGRAEGRHHWAAGALWLPREWRKNCNNTEIQVLTIVQNTNNSYKNWSHSHSNIALNCCVYLYSSSFLFWSSLIASALGYWIAAFLVARARFFRRLQNRLLLWRMSLRASLSCVSWQRESTIFCPTIMINLLWDMKTSGGWLLLRLLLNTAMALWRAPKHSLHCSGTTIFLAESCWLRTAFFFVDGNT